MITTLLFLVASTATAADSIGSETINGKVYLLHRVEPKETLYSISRRYGVTIASIVEQNPGSDAGLEVGQVIKVLYVRRSAVKTRNGTIHKVAPKETLYSIARLYGVEVADLRSSNGLKDDNLSVGQELTIPRVQVPVKPPAQVQSVRGVHTVTAGETLYSIARQYAVSVDDLKKWNSLNSTELKPGQTLFLAQPAFQKETVTATTTSPPPNPVQKTETVTPAVVAGTPPAEPTLVISESVRNSDEIVESGVGEVLEGSEGNRKYLALHRTAPVGSILKVRNEMNQREVFVRVVGPLPETGPNSGLLIKVSKSACDRMGVIDPRFRVQVTYYK